MAEDPKREHDGAASPGPGAHRAAAEAAEEAFFTREQEDPAALEDDVDPELLALPLRRRRRHPVLSVAVIGLSLYLMWFVRADLLFYFRSSDPLDLGEVAQAVQGGKLVPNSFVTIAGAPDRKHALVLQRRFSGYDNFFRLQRGGGRLFVQQHRRTRTIDQEVSYTHTGRLVRFDGLAYATALRDYFARTITTAHDLDFREIARAKRSKSRRLRDQQGQTVRVSPDELVWINAAHPEEWVVQFSRRRFDEKQATDRLAEIGLPHAPGDESRMFWRFIVRANAEQADQLKRRFAAPELQIGVVRRQVSYSAKWDQIEIDGDALLIRAADKTFPPRFRVVQDKLEPVAEPVVRLHREWLLYVTVGSRFMVPHDAMVVITDDRPSDYWHYLALYLILLAFIAINATALVSSLRQRKTD